MNEATHVHERGEHELRQLWEQFKDSGSPGP